MKFIPEDIQLLIVGSFPIGKFTNPKRKSEILPNEIDFFYGGEKNRLWRLIGDCYSLNLNSKEKIQTLLETKKIGVADVIYSCVRVENRADDKALTEIEFNPEIQEIIKIKSLKKILFTSKQVCIWFHQNWKTPENIEEVILPSPSGQGPRGIGKTEKYKEWKKQNPSLKVYEYCLEEYKKVFV